MSFISSPPTDSCIENDSLSLLDKTLDDQADTASIRSRGSVHSVGSSDQQQRGVAMPRLEPFSPGQVFNHSHTQQVLVLPTADDHIMEVNATWPQDEVARSLTMGIHPDCGWTPLSSWTHLDQVHVKECAAGHRNGLNKHETFPSLKTWRTTRCRANDYCWEKRNKNCFLPYFVHISLNGFIDINI